MAVIGAAVALTANEFSSRGLALSRNYFPAGTNQAATAPKQVQAAPSPATTNQPTPAEQLSARLRDKGLQEIKRSAVEKLVHDPRVLSGLVVFVDAREEDHYQEGHLPGAYELDPYHPEKQIAVVLPACQAADQVIVYCTGGECEDADTAALFLRDAGVPAAKLFVFGGGYAEWEAAHLPLEAGARNSGLQPGASQ